MQSHKTKLNNKIVHFYVQLSAASDSALDLSDTSLTYSLFQVNNPPDTSCLMRPLPSFRGYTVLDPCFTWVGCDALICYSTERLIPSPHLFVLLIILYDEHSH